MVIHPSFRQGEHIFFFISAVGTFFDNLENPAGHPAGLLLCRRADRGPGYTTKKLTVLIIVGVHKVDGLKHFVQIYKGSDDNQ